MSIIEEYNQEIKNVIDLMKSLTDKDKVKVMTHFCHECGWHDKDNNGCFCWNDE